MRKQCPYCEENDNGFVILNETKDYSGIEVGMNKQGIMRVRFGYADCALFESQDVINIKYCPMCGRKLTTQN